MPVKPSPLRASMRRHARLACFPHVELKSFTALASLLSSRSKLLAGCLIPTQQRGSSRAASPRHEPCRWGAGQRCAHRHPSAHCGNGEATASPDRPTQLQASPCASDLVGAWEDCSISALFAITGAFLPNQDWRYRFSSISFYREREPSGDQGLGQD